VAASLTAAENADLAEALRQVLKAVEEPAELTNPNLSYMDQVEAYAARTLLLLDLARHLQLNAETLKNQPQEIARLAGDYLRKRLPDVYVKVNANGSFSLSLTSMAQQLSVFKAAAESFASAA